MLLAIAMGVKAGKAAYMADSPLLPGVRWLRMELSLSLAIISSMKGNTGQVSRRRSYKLRRRPENVEKRMTK